VYKPYRTTSVIVYNKHHNRIVTYRSSHNDKRSYRYDRHDSDHRDNYQHYSRDNKWSYDRHYQNGGSDRSKSYDNRSRSSNYDNNWGQRQNNSSQHNSNSTPNRTSRSTYTYAEPSQTTEEFPSRASTRRYEHSSGPTESRTIPDNTAHITQPQDNFKMSRQNINQNYIRPTRADESVNKGKLTNSAAISEFKNSEQIPQVKSFRGRN
jgi:hypothetical protein